MDENKIPLTTIAARLERCLQTDVGMPGLQVLLYGWQHHRRFHAVSNRLLAARRYTDGYRWLTYQETLSLSRYAGYNLAD